jgi:hypothetical protein
MDEPQPVLRNGRPVRHRVAGCLRYLKLDRLHIRGSGKSALLTTVVEVQMGHDYGGDVGGCQTGGAEGSGERHGLWVVPLVNCAVAQPNTPVHQDVPIRMSETQACTGNGSNVAWSGCHSGTEVTVASIRRSTVGSFDRGTKSNLVLNLSHAGNVAIAERGAS